MRRYPDVSVIIPVYNGERFITRAIGSVLAQSYPASEIVVINDGSTDRTEGVLSNFGSKIRVISIANSGVSNARNVGIATCTGDLVAFLDADDVWRRDKLKIQVSIFDKYPNLGFCCCDYLVFNSFLNKEVNHYSIFANDREINYNEPMKIDPFKVLLKQNFVGTASTVIVKKSILNEVGVFNVTYKQSEDYDLWLRCALVTNFVVLSDVLVEKKTHTDNLTNNYLETCLCHEQVLLAIQVRYRSRLHQDNLWQASYFALAQKRYEIGNLYFEAGFISRAFSYFFRGLAVDWSPKNIGNFLSVVSRKSIRLISGGLVKRRK